MSETLSAEDSKVLYVVVPCLDESECLESTAEKLKCFLKTLIRQSVISDKSRILFIDDGSTDSTWEIISGLHEEDEIFSGVRFSKNFGQQQALSAGYKYASLHADAAVSLDCDLQDDLEAVKQMIQVWQSGIDIVHGVRSTRECDTWFKRWSAETCYRIMSALGIKIIFNHGDFRLISRKVLSVLARYRENDLFYRGLIPSLGFKQECVYYKRAAREKGTTHYSFLKMASLALNGIFSLSAAPLRMIFFSGLFILLAGIGISLFYIILAIQGKPVSGNFAFLISSGWVLAGIMTVCIGILGIYMERVFLQGKGRPCFLIDETTDDLADHSDEAEHNMSSRGY